ncbi:hypothetical protein C8Q74DRAFT_324079 [Fomes fomentarius]|nr:hypothetical protein C8Q74DRAFT_324079 [Fomes fomentarius]
MLTLQAAAIFSTTIEGILFGYSVFMFTLAMYIMLRARHRRRVNYAMVAAGCALLTLATAEMGVNIARIYEGFISKGLAREGGPEGFFADVSETTFVLKSCLYNTQTLILDAVVIYRTYVVWQKFWIVVVPIVGWLGLLAGSIGLNVALATASSHKGDVFAVQTGLWITAVYSLTLGTNLSSTTLLAFRIWTVTRKSAQYRCGNILTPVLRVIIESGAIYSVTITAALISFVVKSNGVYVLLDMISPIISIVFNMLIIRVGLASERSLGGTTTTPQGTWAAAVSSSSQRSGPRRRHHGIGMGIGASFAMQMQDLKVEITQVVEEDSDYSPHYTHCAAPDGPGDEERESAAGTGTTLSAISFAARPAVAAADVRQFRSEPPLGMPIVVLESPADSSESGRSSVNGGGSGKGRAEGHAS